MNIVWFVNKYPDYDNIYPIIYFLKTKKIVNIIDVCLLGKENDDINRNLKSAKSKNIINGIINPKIILNNNNKIIYNYSIFDWGPGYPNSIYQYIRWCFNKKLFNDRTRLIKKYHNSKTKLICFPHGIAMHTNQNIKKISRLRSLYNFIFDSITIEDYSDREIFDSYIFYNSRQKVNYEKLYNMKGCNSNLMELYKYNKEYISTKKIIVINPQKKVILSLPKLHNNIDIEKLTKVISHLRNRLNNLFLLIHPRFNLNDIPDKLREAISNTECSNKPFSYYSNICSHLIDVGSSIILDALSIRIDVLYLNYLDKNKIVNINDKNFTEINTFNDLVAYNFDIIRSKSEFSLPKEFKDGERIKIEDLII